MSIRSTTAEPDFDAPVEQPPEPAEVRQPKAARPDLAQKVSYLPDVHRKLPQAKEAEEGLICSALIMPREVLALCDEKGITVEAFHFPHHATIFRRCRELVEKHGTLDIVTLTNELRDRNELDNAGGAAHITQLFTYLPTAANARYYADIVLAKWTLRRIIVTATEHAAKAYDEQEDAAGALDSFEKAAMDIRKGSDDHELREEDPQDSIMEAVRAIEAAYESRGAITGLSTGFAALDQMIDGLHPEEMTVIAARPSMGKTALAMNIAEHIAINEGKTVAVFSLEMSTQQLTQRLIASRARVNMARIRQGFLSDADFPAITTAASTLASSRKLRIIDAIGASINTIRGKARRMKRAHPDLAAIVIDYLQLIRATSRQAQGNREREVAEVSAGLKGMAKELGIPVVVLAQLGRDVEKRTGGVKGRPRLSDLRESGSIEQDADVVGLLVREEYYAETEEEKREAEGKATLIIAKQRNGPIGDVPLTFLKEFARFTSRATESSADDQQEAPQPAQPDLV